MSGRPNRKWPVAVTEPDCSWGPVPEGLGTACKHGLGECEACGTTVRRDLIHSTRCGTGKVGSLFKK